MPRNIKSERRQMVYTGALHHNGELVYVYYFVLEHGDLDDKAQLYSNPLGDFPPGAVCSYGIQTNGTVRTEGAIFERIWPDAKIVEEWIARHAATTASEAAWESKHLPPAFQSLEPMRAAYRRLDEERQGVLVAQIVRYLVTHDKEI